MERTSRVLDWPGRCDRARPAIDDSGLRRLVGYQLRRAEMAMQQRFSLEIGVPLGLRQVEFFVLSLLTVNETVTHKQISEALAIAPSNMVAIMSGLETRGLVARQANPADGRSFFWGLTEDGEQLARRAEAAVSRMDRAALGDLEPGRDQLTHLLDGLWSGDPPD